MVCVLSVDHPEHVLCYYNWFLRIFPLALGGTLWHIHLWGCWCPAKYPQSSGVCSSDSGTMWVIMTVSVLFRILSTNPFSCSPTWTVAGTVYSIYELLSRRSKSFGMWLCVSGWKIPIMLKDCSAVIFGVIHFLGAAWPWRWKHYSSLLHWYQFTSWCTVAVKMTWVFSNTTVKTSDLVLFVSLR